MARMVIDWDEKAMEDEMNRSEATFKLVNDYVAKKVSHANSMASGYESRGFYSRGQLVDGKKQARYDGNTQRNGKGWIVGLVFTGNNSAYNENLEHNTIMKA